MARTHVVGAGLAGLAAAVSLVRRGRTVTLYEASGQAGGRCRSYRDTALACTIDNGNHLLLSGNRAAMRYLADIGSAHKLRGPPSACFPFLELSTGVRWELRPNRGRLPWWVASTRRRIPGTTVWSYLPALRLPLARRSCTVTDCVRDSGILYTRLWEPLALAALNTPARTADARLLWSVLKHTFARGESACRPRVASTGLSDTFVDPALTLIAAAGSGVRFGHRLGRIEYAGNRARRLEFGKRPVRLGPDDSVVLALPPAAIRDLVPGTSVPQAGHIIVNVHYVLPHTARLPGGSPFLGLIGGTAQWLFVRGPIASVTISAADDLAGVSAPELALRTWSEIASVLGGAPHPVPAFRVLKERRATFAQTPEEVRRRPPTRTALANVFLAGDWIDTGIPATIEGAVQSGNAAAEAAAGGLTV